MSLLSNPKSKKNFVTMVQDTTIIRGSSFQVTGRAVSYSPPLKVELPLQYLLRESMGCGVSNEMPLVEEDAISKNLQRSKESTSSSGGVCMFCWLCQSQRGSFCTRAALLVKQPVFFSTSPNKAKLLIQFQCN